MLLSTAYSTLAPYCSSICCTKGQSNRLFKNEFGHTKLLIIISGFYTKAGCNLAVAALAAGLTFILNNFTKLLTCWAILSLKRSIPNTNCGLYSGHSYQASVSNNKMCL